VLEISGEGLDDGEREALRHGSLFTGGFLASDVAAMMDLTAAGAAGSSSGSAAGRPSR
jgi:hypothetical protein